MKHAEILSKAQQNAAVFLVKGVNYGVLIK